MKVGQIVKMYDRHTGQVQEATIHEVRSDPRLTFKVLVLRVGEEVIEKAVPFLDDISKKKSARFFWSFRSDVISDGWQQVPPDKE